MSKLRVFIVPSPLYVSDITLYGISSQCGFLLLWLWIKGEKIRKADVAQGG